MVFMQVSDDSLEDVFASLDLDHKNLARLLHFDHSRKKVFLRLGSLSRIPLESYLNASFQCYLYRLDTGNSERNRSCSSKSPVDNAMKPPELDMFCEFLASLTSLFDGVLKETEHLAFYMLANQGIHSSSIFIALFSSF